jgi:hypothetical protein
VIHGDQATHLVRIDQRGVELQGFLNGPPSLWDGLPGWKHAQARVQPDLPLCEGGVCRSERGVLCNGRAEVGDGPPHRLVCPLVERVHPPQVRIVGHDVEGRPVLHGSGEPRLQLNQNACRNLILDRKDVGQLAVEPLGPALVAVVRIDELRRDAHRVAGFANASFENGADAQSPADLRDLEVFALKGERRRAGNHPESGHSRQRADDLFSDAMTEVLLIVLRAHIHEREHDDRRWSGVPG